MIILAANEVVDLIEYTEVEGVQAMTRVGVPVMLQRYADVERGSPRHRYFVASWLHAFVKNWPLSDADDDYGHHTLRTAIRRALQLEAMARGLGREFTQAALTVARLDGEAGVTAMMDPALREVLDP
jgi:hypothetical protein